jgi:hypothetical protein
LFAVRGVDKCSPVQSRRGRRWAGKLGSGKPDDGVVLVVWVLAITPLIACLAIAIGLGLLVEASDNAQNATDAAALSAVDVLASSGELVDTTIPILQSADCRVSGNSLGNCSSVSWLDGYYLYYAIDQDADDCGPEGATGLTLLEIVPFQPPPCAGEIYDRDALAGGEDAGWTCGSVAYNGHHHNHGVCVELDTGVSVSGNFALSPGRPPLVTAADDVEQLVMGDYQVSSAWSGCPSAQLPGGFSRDPSLAPPNDCVAYEVTNHGNDLDLVVWVTTISPTPPSVFAGNIESAQFRRVAWAFSTLGGGPVSEPALCTGSPSVSGNCP